MIIVTGSVRAKEGCIEEALSVSLEHVRRSRLEPGCLAHAVHVDAEDPLRLVFVEEWADVDALRAHFAVPESRAFVAEVSGLAQEAPTMAIFQADRLRM